MDIFDNVEVIVSISINYNTNSFGNSKTLAKVELKNGGSMSLSQIQSSVRAINDNARNQIMGSLIDLNELELARKEKETAI